MAFLLGCEKVRVEFPTKTVFEGVSLGVDERPVGGLGIHLIKSVVAHYTYAYYEQSNIIELYFALPE